MYTVVSLSLGYHWKMDIWYLNTVQLHWVTVNLACIMMTTQSEDMRCDESRAVTGFILFSYNPYVQVMRMYQVSWEGRVCAGTAPSPVRSVRQITPSARCAPDSSLVSTAAISHTTTTWKVKWYLVKHAEYYSFYSAVWFLPSTVMVRPCWLR